MVHIRMFENRVLRRIFGPRSDEVMGGVEEKYIMRSLTLSLLTTTIVAPPSNASKWQMGFNSAFKGLNNAFGFVCNCRCFFNIP